MQIPGMRVCDLCGRTVAKSHGLLFHTEEPYVTVRMDAPTTYVNMEEHTTKSKLHFCAVCFYAISVKAEEALKEGSLKRCK